MVKVAIVHDWLVAFGGAEKVLADMIAIWPNADIFSVVDFFSDGSRAAIGGNRAKTTFIQRLPFAKTKYRAYLPLMPLAIEQLDVSGYDLVISSSHAVAKGVLTGPDQLHICYIHSPVRYAWDLQHEYLRESGLERGFKGVLARYFLHKIRMWDMRTSNGVDKFIANSGFIARRVMKVYHRESVVIYPPVEVDKFSFVETKDDFYLTASRLVPYKRVDLIVEAFSKMPDKRLVVIGDGPDMEKVKAKASRNVQILGFQDFSVLRDHMQRARAFVFAAEEDFGITPVEAQACGTPVIAFGKGGALESVVGAGAKPTGLFFNEQSVDAICEAVNKFEALPVGIVPSDCRENAERFSQLNFAKKMKSYVDAELSKFEAVLP